MYINSREYILFLLGCFGGESGQKSGEKNKKIDVQIFSKYKKKIAFRTDRNLHMIEYFIIDSGTGDFQKTRI